jgi:hypothetical protein
LSRLGACPASLKWVGDQCPDHRWLVWLEVRAARSPDDDRRVARALLQDLGEAFALDTVQVGALPLINAAPRWQRALEAAAAWARNEQVEPAELLDAVVWLRSPPVKLALTGGLISERAHAATRARLVQSEAPRALGDPRMEAAFHVAWFGHCSLSSFDWGEPRFFSNVSRQAAADAVAHASGFTVRRSAVMAEVSLGRVVANLEVP